MTMPRAPYGVYAHIAQAQMVIKAGNRLSRRSLCVRDVRAAWGPGRAAERVSVWPFVG